MKLTLPLALFAVAVAAQSSSSSNDECDAIHIVETCYSSESSKLDACSKTDYDCQCRASEAIATCFNNCPNDSRAGVYRSQVTIYCNNASVHGTAARASTTSAATTASGSESGTTASEAEATTTGSSSTGTADSEAAEETGSDVDDDSGAGQLARNAGGVLLSVAGVVAAVL